MQECHPVALYLNGKYWGLFDLYERKNNNFIKNHYHIKPKDIINAGPLKDVVIRGSARDYQIFIDSINNMSMQDSRVIEYVNSQFYINSLLDYWAHKIYTNKLDRLNNRLWKPKGKLAKWRYISYDFDLCLDKPTTARFLKQTQDTIAKGFNIIGRLLLNEEFKMAIFERLCDFNNFGYTKNNILQLIEQIDKLSYDEFELDFINWKGELYRNYYDPERLKQMLLNFTSTHSKYLMNTIAPKFEITEKVIIENLTQAEGDIFVNGFAVKGKAIYFIKMELDIEVKPKQGYGFSGWEDSVIKISQNGKIIFDNPVTLIPIFTRI